MKKLLLIALLAFFTPRAYCWPDQDTVKNFIDWYNKQFGWHESIAFIECINGTEYYVTYVVFDSDGTVSNIPVKVTNTHHGCGCKISGFSTQPAQSGAALATPESDCESGNKNGKPTPLSGQGTPGSTGGSGPGSTGGVLGGGGVLVTTRPAPRAVQGSTTFDFTLPYRALGAAPVDNKQLPQVPWTCNSKVNPTMFVVAHVANTVTRYDQCTLAPVAVIQVPDLPLQVRVTPDGSQAVVTSYGNAITFIDTSTNTVTKTINTDPNFTPSGLAIMPDGHYALVTNYEPPPQSYIAVVDLQTKQIIRQIALDTEYPQSVFVSPDGTLAWVTFPWDNRVSVIDLLTGVAVFNFSSILEPFSVAFNSTGTVAYVSSGAGSVSVINTKNYSQIASVPTAAGSQDLVVTPDEAWVFVTNSEAKSVTLIDTRNNKSLTTTVGGTPHAGILAPTQ